MTTWLRVTESPIEEALKRLARDPHWTYVIQCAEKELDEVMIRMANPGGQPQSLEWYSGRLSALMELVSAARDERVRNG
jgi:hypothetical protein